MLFNTLEEAEELALKNRYELMQLEQAANASQSAVAIADAGFLPGINLVVDYGFQGEKYRFTKDDDYWMASAVLSWNLFNGFSDKARREQKVIDLKNTRAALDQLKTQIRLQVRNAFYALQVSRKSLLIAAEQEKSATETFKIVSKKYEQGMASQVEFVDARVSMTNAATNNIITRFDYLIHKVELNKTLNVWN